MFCFNSLSLLKNLSENNLNQYQVNNLVETAFKIAAGYIRLNYNKFSPVIFKEGFSIEDTAIDAIAPMFIKNEEGYFYSFRSAINQWQPEPQSDEDASFILNKIISNRVEQHIVLVLKESDPFFKKILDSVNYLIRKNSYSKVNFMGRSFIVQTEKDNIQGETIDEVAFNNLPIELFIDKKKYIDNIFSYINNETGYFPAIPLNLLINHLKKIIADENINENKSCCFKDSLDLTEIITNSIKLTEHKINDTYIVNGKLNIEEAECLRNALSNMIDDLKNNGITGCLYEYLHFYMTNLTKEEYETRYHNILQYLFKLTKNNISKKLIS